MDEATPPQEHQISAFRGVDLGTKRVLPPPYWDSVTEFHRQALGHFKISDSDTFESKKALVEIFGKLTDVNHVSELNTAIRLYLL